MSDEDEPSTGYDITHRALLQAFLARQVFTVKKAQTVLAAIITAKDAQRPVQPNNITQEDLEQHIQTVNDAISPFDLEIKSTLDQRTQEKIYALVNTTSDALTQMATVHTADEIAFVKRVLNAMFETYNTREREIMAVTSTQALNLQKPGEEEADGNVMALSKTQAQDVLSSMERQGWFALSRRGYYSLTPRALMELKEWLFDTYNDAANGDEEDEDLRIAIKKCNACKEIVTVGQRCSRLDCLGRLHEHCKSKMFRAQGGQEICPQCKSPWSSPLHVGEKAARDERRSAVNGE